MSLDYLTDVIILLTAAVILVPLSRSARLAVSENLEASIALAESALSQVSVDDAENDAAIDRDRKKLLLTAPRV